MTPVTLMDLIVRAIVDETFFGEKIYLGKVAGLPSVLVPHSYQEMAHPTDTFLVPFKVKGSPQKYTVRVPVETLLLLTNILRTLREAVKAADQKDPPPLEPKETSQ